jgi:PAS domain S-box-containing protein
LTLTATITGISIWINSSVAGPIAKLEKGSQIIGSGNLDHKIGTTAKDEIGELSWTFDKMTHDLKETTTSIVELNKEIDERKRAEEALRESELKYRQVFETNKALKLMIDPEDGAIVEANEAACNFYGYSKREMMTMKITDINALPPEKTHLEMQKAINEERLYFRFAHRLASGEVRDVEVYSGPVNLGKKTILYSIIHDVTDRIDAENKIRENEARYRLLFNSCISLIQTVNPVVSLKPMRSPVKCMATPETNY